MVLGFLRGRKGARQSAATGGPGEVAGSEQYNGFELQARPIREKSGWRIAGSIRRPGDPDGPSHDFVRADEVAGLDDAVQLCLIKARQIVDERGDALLGSGG